MSVNGQITDTTLQGLQVVKSKISDRQDEEIMSSNYLFQDSSPDSRRSLRFESWCLSASEEILGKNYIFQ